MSRHGPSRFCAKPQVRAVTQSVTLQHGHGYTQAVTLDAYESVTKTVTTVTHQSRHVPVPPYRGTGRLALAEACPDCGRSAA